ncbi:MAG: UDP-N-acetylmuramate dehydrogenase [Candidatus Levybacteria bacterium]|nr:UDP-N-acetylmuramate dehydrogenase [Candidatus Levybacteria bacterium]
MEIVENAPLSEISYYKIGGKAKYLLKIQSRDDLQEALAFISNQGITRILPLGLGANMLISDDGFDGAVLWFAKPEKDGMEVLHDGRVKVFASYTLEEVSEFSFANNFIGLGWTGGLPSTVGAAVRGNVGCFGKAFEDVFERAEVLEITPSGVAAKELSKEEMKFGYRTSVVKQNPSMIVASVILTLHQASLEQVADEKKEYEERIAYRNSHHPVEYPSCGSVFKNIIDEQKVEKILSIWPDILEQVEGKWHHKVSMGYVIKRLGFSKFTVGGAQVSQKHCNYIINMQNATFKDVYEIIETIKGKFYDTFGFYPEEEVQIVP